MKRMTALLMVLGLLCGLFVGCGGTHGETEMAQTEPQSVQSEPTTTQAEPEPTQTEPTETEPAPEIVYNYTAKYTRLSDEPLNELVPSEEYGCILPFQAEAVDGFVCGDAYVNTGFIDASGRIIVDPVYQTVCPLTAGSEDGCIWLMGQGEVADLDMSGYHFYLENARYGFATSDGSVVIDLMYDDIQALGNRIFAKKYVDDTHEAYDVDIYDKKCELVGSMKNVRYRLEGYSEDILVVYKDGSYYYMDLSGKILCGPYSEAEPFSCGYGLVRIGEWNDGYYTYVDRNGKKISEDGWMVGREDSTGTYQIMGFDRAESFVNGNACVELLNGWDEYTVLTTDGELRFPFRYFNGYDCIEEYILDSGRGGTNIYAPDGTLLHSYPELNMVRAFKYNPDLLYDSWSNRIYNWKTQEWFDGFDGLEPNDSFACTDTLYYLFDNWETEEAVLIDENWNVLYRMNNFSSWHWDEVNGKVHLFCRTEDTSRLIIPHLGVDTDQFEEYQTYLRNDMIMTVDGGACCYYNSDLELVFCYPFG